MVELHGIANASSALANLPMITFAGNKLSVSLMFDCVLGHCQLISKSVGVVMATPRSDCSLSPHQRLSHIWSLLLHLYFCAFEMCLEDKKGNMEREE